MVYAFSRNEGIGPKWEKCYLEYCKFIMKILSRNSRILEIGGGNLKLANNISKFGVKNISIVQTEKKYINSKYDFYLDFFESIDFKIKFDAIYSSHVFEHIDDFDIHINKILEVSTWRNSC